MPDQEHKRDSSAAPAHKKGMPDEFGCERWEEAVLTEGSIIGC